MRENEKGTSPVLFQELEAGICKWQGSCWPSVQDKASCTGWTTGLPTTRTGCPTAGGETQVAGPGVLPHGRCGSRGGSQSPSR